MDIASTQGYSKLILFLFTTENLMAFLRGITIKANDPSKLADFYRAVFELKTVSEDPI